MKTKLSGKQFSFTVVYGTFLDDALAASRGDFQLAAVLFVKKWNYQTIEINNLRNELLQMTPANDSLKLEADCFSSIFDFYLVVVLP